MAMPVIISMSPAIVDISMVSSTNIEIRKSEIKGLRNMRLPMAAVEEVYLMARDQSTNVIPISKSPMYIPPARAGPEGIRRLSVRTL